MSGVTGNSPVRPKPESRSPFFRRGAPAIALGVTVLTLAYMKMTNDPIAMKTISVGNIEKRYSAGGAKPTHTPGYGGTATTTSSAAQMQSPSSGKDTFHLQKGGAGGEEQRPTESGMVGKNMNQLAYGNSDGK